MKKEYKVKVTEKTATYFYVDAESDDEAKRKVHRIREQHDYCDDDGEFEGEEYEILEKRTVNGKDLGTGYIKEMDTTIIWENEYVEGELIHERIVGYYHGEPNDYNTAQYAYKGVEVWLPR